MPASRLGVPAAAVLAAVAALTMVAPARAAFPGPNGRIAVSADWPPCDWDEEGVLLLDPAGGAPQSVTCNGGRAEWLPGGNRLLVETSIMATDGTVVRTVHAGSEASIAPVGHHVVFVRNLNRRGPILRSRLDGHERRRLGPGLLPRWSPGGRRIAFDGRRGLTVMRARDGRHRRVLAHGVHPAGLDWSPDGRRLVYATGGNLFRIRADGRGRPHRLHAPPPAPDETQALSLPTWSPDGTRIAFERTGVTTPASVQFSIWTTTPTGRDARRLYTTGPLDRELFRPADALSWGRAPG